MPYSIDVNLQIKKKNKQREMRITNWGTVSYMTYHFPLCSWAQNHAIHIKKN